MHCVGIAAVTRRYRHVRVSGLIVVDAVALAASVLDVSVQPQQQPVSGVLAASTPCHTASSANFTAPSTSTLKYVGYVRRAYTLH